MWNRAEQNEWFMVWNRAEQNGWCTVWNRAEMSGVWCGTGQNRMDGNLTISGSQLYRITLSQCCGKILYVCFSLCAVFLQVGTEIILTLSYSWDFKQAMLTTTIRDGVVEVQ